MSEGQRAQTGYALRLGRGQQVLRGGRVTERDRQVVSLTRISVIATAHGRSPALFNVFSSIPALRGGVWMFSQKIYAEIARVTQKTLDEMRSRKTIDQVTVILGYVQLSSRNVAGYDAEVREAIEGLLELARAENQHQLVDALEALRQQMD